MKNTLTPPPAPVVDEDLLRDYAYHLYLQVGCIPGRELAVWREAMACLSVSLAQAEPSIAAT